MLRLNLCFVHFILDEGFHMLHFIIGKAVSSSKITKKDYVDVQYCVIEGISSVQFCQSKKHKII